MRSSLVVCVSAQGPTENPIAATKSIFPGNHRDSHTQFCTRLQRLVDLPEAHLVGPGDLQALSLEPRWEWKHPVSGPGWRWQTAIPLSPVPFLLQLKDSLHSQKEIRLTFDWTNRTRSQRISMEDKSKREVWINSNLPTSDDFHMHAFLPSVESGSRSVVSDSLQPPGLYSPWNSPGQNTGVGSLSLLQGFLPTQGLNPGLPHCRRILYQLRHQGSPR